MADDRDRKEPQDDSTYSGRTGERNRNTPGRTPAELGLDEDEKLGHGFVGNTSDRTGDVSFDPDDSGPRRNPDRTPGVEGMGEGGLSASGGTE